LFAAQDGAKFYAGQGKVEIQAQADGADLIARKGVQIISTEDAIYITSPKEIKLIADGSELKINSSGVFATTSGKFEVKAGQHLFMGGERFQLNYLIYLLLGKIRVPLNLIMFMKTYHLLNKPRMSCYLMMEQVRKDN
jgi:type VI secretion system secreted protein VgrG